ncbi:hypothetical protein SCUP515_07043 [Seiridium cupressi]
MPTVTIPDQGPPKATNTDQCKVCSTVGSNNLECEDLPNCTPKTTTTSSPTATPTTTTSIPPSSQTPSFYIHVETQQNVGSDTGADIDDYYAFYKGPVACADVPLALFLETGDVTEVAASSARCVGCTVPLDPNSDDQITQFDWYDKSDAGTWGHYSFEDRFS